MLLSVCAYNSWFDTVRASYGQKNSSSSQEMALPASNHSFKKKSIATKNLTRGWPKHQSSPTRLLKSAGWRNGKKKKEFEHLWGRAKKIKNVFTIDYSIGKTHRKLQLDAEPSWKSMQKFQNEPWNERIKGIKKGPGIKMKTAQFYSKTSFLARWRVAWHSCMWTMTSM